MVARFYGLLGPGLFKGTGLGVCSPLLLLYGAAGPCSSVAEHLHGKEGVVGSIPTEGSPVAA